MKNLTFDKTVINNGFWKFYSDLDRSSVVYNVYNRFKETGRFDALKCSWREGMPNKPHIYWDSDIVKWIEGVAYLIEHSPEPQLEKLVDEMIDDIEENQREDGYFNSYYLTIEPDNIFTERHNHELYCLGHAIEAAIAYHKATKKDKFLNCVLKNIDMVYRTFITEKQPRLLRPVTKKLNLLF